jgi:DNA-binding transcriptional LysR family regulator
VYEEGGFARAGILLETVQSNVSARIRRLEAALGVQLFERHRRGVVVTEKGEKLYRHAKRVIALLEETPGAVSGKEAA